MFEVNCMDAEVEGSTAGRNVQVHCINAEVGMNNSEKYKAKVVVIVAKYHNWKDDFKDVVEIIRDSAFSILSVKK